MSTFTSYLIGYLFSILLTLLAVGGLLLHTQTHHTFPTHSELRLLFVILAVIQLVVQLYFFLHVGRGRNKHWNAVVLGFAFFIVTVVVGGTIWIMQNLNTNAMQNSPFINSDISAQNSND